MTSWSFAVSLHASATGFIVSLLLIHFVVVAVVSEINLFACLHFKQFFCLSRFNACIHYFALWLLCINILVKKLSRAGGIPAKVKLFLSSKALLTSIVLYFIPT